MRYRRPNGSPILQHWGSEVSTFRVTTLLSGDGYLEKLRYLQQLLVIDTTDIGGDFHHPLYGKFAQTFVEEYSITTVPAPFNASLVEITFITANNGVGVAIKATTLSKINTFINNALNVASLVGSIGTLEAQLKTLYPSSFFPSSSFAGSANEFIQVENISDTHLKGRSTNLQETNPKLSDAVFKLNSSKIPLDYDPEIETQVIIEKCCQYANITVAGYGQGGLSSTTQENLNVINTATYVNTSTTSIDGTITAISYQTIGSNSDGTSILQKSTTVTNPVTKPDNASSLKSSVNNLVTFGGVMSKLYPELYYSYTALISSVEELVDEVFKSGSDTQYTLKQDDIPVKVAFQFGMDIKDFFALNSNILIGHRPLNKGMSVTVAKGSK